MRKGKNERKGTKRNVSEARYAKVDKEKRERERETKYTGREEKEGHTVMAKR